MTSNVCCVGDLVTGFCSAGGHADNRPFTGHWTTCKTSILLEDSIKIITVGDEGITDCGHTFVASTGSEISQLEGRGLHRVGDEVLVIGGGYGHSITGSEAITSV